ncbi:hypothetical protein JCM10908_000624 [Rhodotorula pacifica]|uniref:uncharacterized protein n=1 Tax=Rhodotorula pacifica TaxID=1495444 RepID=UPI00316FDE7E
MSTHHGLVVHALPVPRHGYADYQGLVTRLRGVIQLYDQAYEAGAHEQQPLTQDHQRVLASLRDALQALEDNLASESDWNMPQLSRIDITSAYLDDHRFDAAWTLRNVDLLRDMSELVINTLLNTYDGEGPDRASAKDRALLIEVKTVFVKLQNRLGPAAVWPSFGPQLQKSLLNQLLHLHVITEAALSGQTSGTQRDFQREYHAHEALSLGLDHSSHRRNMIYSRHDGSASHASRQFI